VRTIGRQAIMGDLFPAPLDIGSKSAFFSANPSNQKAPQR
jgi:hypothetical protein